jgi:ArsR family transcriptional regulator
METQEIPSITGLLKVLSDETRLRALSLLQSHELAVGELQKILGVGQSTLSTHLGQLRDCKLVQTRKEGQKVYYSLVSEETFEAPFSLVEIPLSQIQGQQKVQEDKQRLESILQERTRETIAFFEQLDHQLEEDTKPPGQNTDLLACGLLQLLPGEQVVDMGCGSGKLTLMMAESGKQVIGIDNSQGRIQSAQQRLQNHPRKKELKVQFLQTHMENTQLPPGETDLVLLSQALHHAADPLRVFKESYRLLKPRGKLLMLDLHSHQEEWMRDRFGDFWLGFSKENVLQWLEESQLQIGSLLFPQFPTTTQNTPIQTLIVTANKV